MSRCTNKDLLRKLIEENGLAKVSLATDVGISTLEKIRAGTYRSQLSHKTMRKICSGLRVSIDALFPEAIKDKAS